MTDDKVTMRLTVALNHLHAFAATFNPEDLVDEESKLSALAPECDPSGARAGELGDETGTRRLIRWLAEPRTNVEH